MTSYRCQQHDGMLAQNGCATCELSLYIKRLEKVAEAAKAAHICDGDFQDESGDLQEAIAALELIGGGE